MPVPNELTPEDEALFAEHGVEPLGAGGDPVNDETSPPPPPEEPPVEDPPLTPVASPARDEHGRFIAATPAPVPPTPPEAAPSPGGEPSPAPPAPPPGFVPHAALHQERVERQRIAAEYAQLQARTNALLARQQPQTLELPDLETDPVGYVRALGEHLRDQQQTTAAQAQRTQLEQAFEQDEALFSSYTPDYNQAAEHFANSRAAELANFHTPEQAQNIMMDEAREIARAAWARGVPAAQMVYQMAISRGYRPGTAPAAAPAAVPAQASPAAVVAAARAGQQASRSLSAAAGAGAATALNAEALLSMSDEEFADYLKLGEKGANARFASIG